jgi:homoserine acetyltransferase
MLSDTEQGDKQGIPNLSPDFLIETYLDHQGERFCLTYDANSMIYLSKAMDLFDLTAPALKALAKKFNDAYPNLAPFPLPSDPPSVSASSPRRTASEQPAVELDPAKKSARFIPTSRSTHLPELAEGLQRLKDIPALVLGVQSDILFPVEQQRELADALKMAGNSNVTYYELGGVWGSVFALMAIGTRADHHRHDTFLLDVQNVGGAIRGFLH